MKIFNILNFLQYKKQSKRLKQQQKSIHLKKVLIPKRQENINCGQTTTQNKQIVSIEIDMGNILLNRITPQQKKPTKKHSLLQGSYTGQVSRSDFRFITRISVTGNNQQQTIWLAENIRNSEEKFLVKQIDKVIMYDNNRKMMALQQLMLWKNVYQQHQQGDKDNAVVGIFLAEFMYAFQDYQYLYAVYQYNTPGYTLDSVFREHTFTEEETKYVVAVLIIIMEYFHQQGYSLTQLSPEHFIVDSQTGRIKLLQIFNPMPIDTIYEYMNITLPNVYSSPEVLARNKVRAESDFYTLGTFMYEMMTQKKILSQELSSIQHVQRYHIMAQDIELKKYNLPEGWNPQAADFLVKLLIKNPLYRLGRYGSFQLRFHPWLQNYNWQILATRNGIKLSQSFFSKNQTKTFPKIQHNFINNPLVDALLHDPLFIRLFERYQYRRTITNNENNIMSFEKILQKQYSKGMKSQKYYDEQQKGQNSQSSSSSEDIQDVEDEQNIQMQESESMGRSYNESVGGGNRGRVGKGLLNIMPKKT